MQNYPEYQLLRVRIGRELVHRSQNAFVEIRGYSILGKNFAGTSYDDLIAFMDSLFLSVSFTCRVALVSSRINFGYDLILVNVILRNVDSKKWSLRIKYYNFRVFIFPELMCWPIYFDYLESTYVFGDHD